jgi:acyl-CoA synthetase (AMP-forming)/AMP-acid ligase II
MVDPYTFSATEDVSNLLKALPPRISDVIKPWAEKSPGHPALAEASGQWTYGDLAAAVSETAAWLLDSGVRPGDRVMLVCENGRAFVGALLATASIDAWPVLVSARLSAREVDLVREHCDPRLVIYTTAVSPHATEHAKRHGSAVRQVGQLGPVGVSEISSQCVPEGLDANPTHNVGALIYTSGTTGLPKGVMLSHRNVLFVGAVAARMRSLGPHDRLLGVLPMSHAVGLAVVLLGGLMSGVTLYLAPRFDPVRVFANLERDRLTVVLGAPSMFSLLLDYAKLKGLRRLSFPSLRILSSSGAPLQASIKSAVEELFGMTLHNGYGVTECSPNIASTRMDCPRMDLSVGKVFPGIEIRLIASDGCSVATGEIGELWVRGPNIMKGYYHAPEETAAAIDREGWFNTRDLARMEGDHLFIVGRTKELIVRFGLNVYPAEVESVLNSHPAVVRSAVIGRTVAGIDGGEEVLAFVQPSPGSSVTVPEIAEFASQRLAPYKRPSRIELVSSMPLTPTGKVVKEDLVRAINVNLQGAQF